MENLDHNAMDLNLVAVGEDLTSPNQGRRKRELLKVSFPVNYTATKLT